MNNIAIFTGHDSIGLEIVNKLVPRLIEQGFCPTLYNTGHHKNRECITPPLEGIYFSDEHLLEATVIPFLETISAQAPNLTYKQVSERHKVQNHNITDVNNVRLTAPVQGALCIRMKQVFDVDTIANIKAHSQFFWNLHGGMLPDYKGLLSAAWAKINQEQHYGWTLHEISDDGRIDAGPIISAKVIDMPETSVIKNIYAQMVPSSVQMILSSIMNQPSPIIPKRNGSYYSFPSQELMDQSGLAYSTAKTDFEYYTSRFSPSNAQEEFEQEIFHQIQRHYRR